MSLYELTDLIIEFIKAHQIWAIPIVFILTFGESLAIISLLLPATAILVATGALIGADILPFLPIWLAASLGAAVGDLVSYWLGKHYHQQIITRWPLKKHPQLIYRGEQFFLKFGTASIFIGRFFGPFRAIVPLIAGTMRMPTFKFNIANITSAPIWAFVVLAPGAYGLKWLETLFG